MRISDWSSDVCSSDLCRDALDRGVGAISLIMVEDDWVATLLRNRYRDDFIVEPPLAPCRRGALVRPHGIGVRLLARNSEIARHILSGFDHRSEEHTSELQSLMRISYAVFCLKHKNE